MSLNYAIYNGYVVNGGPINTRDVEDIVNTKLEDYPTTTELNTTLEDYTTNNHLNTTLQNYPTNTQLDNTLEDYPTNTQLDNTLEDYPTNTQLDNTLEDYATTSSLNNYVKNNVSQSLNNQFTFNNTSNEISVGTLTVNGKQITDINNVENDTTTDNKTIYSKKKTDNLLSDKTDNSTFNSTVSTINTNIGNCVKNNETQTLTNQFTLSNTNNDITLKTLTVNGKQITDINNVENDTTTDNKTIYSKKKTDNLLSDKTDNSTFNSTISSINTNISHCVKNNETQTLENRFTFNNLSNIYKGDILYTNKIAYNNKYYDFRFCVIRNYLRENGLSSLIAGEKYLCVKTFTSDGITFTKNYIYNIISVSPLQVEIFINPGVENNPVCYCTQDKQFYFYYDGWISLNEGRMTTGDIERVDYHSMRFNDYSLSSIKLGATCSNTFGYYNVLRTADSNYTLISGNGNDFSGKINCSLVGGYLIKSNSGTIIDTCALFGQSYTIKSNLYTSLMYGYNNEINANDNCNQSLIGGLNNKITRLFRYSYLLGESNKINSLTKSSIIGGKNNEITSSVDAVSNLCFGDTNIINCYNYSRNYINGSNHTISANLFNSVFSGQFNTINYQLSSSFIGGSYNEVITTSTQNNLIIGKYNKINGNYTKNGIVCGQYNEPNTTNASIIVVGNGTDDNTRNNALVVYENGNTYIDNDLTVNNDLTINNDLKTPKITLNTSLPINNTTAPSSSTNTGDDILTTKYYVDKAISGELGNFKFQYKVSSNSYNSVSVNINMRYYGDLYGMIFVDAMIPLYFNSTPTQDSNQQVWLQSLTFNGVEYCIAYQPDYQLYSNYTIIPCIGCYKTNNMNYNVSLIAEKPASFFDYCYSIRWIDGSTVRSSVNLNNLWTINLSNVPFINSSLLNVNN